MAIDNTATFKSWWDAANAAGVAAVEKLHVTPMVVQQHTNMADDNSPVAKSWFIADGVCGFAYIQIKATRKEWPAGDPVLTRKFMGWLMNQGIAHKDSYNGGVYVSIWDYNQSYQKKKAHAEAVVDYLQSHGIKCWSQARLD